MTALPDIETRADCETLVRAFYGRALTDPILGYIFTDVAQLDLEAHVPKIASFWETILLGAHSYSGGAFAPHAALNQKVTLFAGHFERWLWLWRMTVDELFAGEHVGAEIRAWAAGAQRVGGLRVARRERDSEPATQTRELDGELVQGHAV
jgi:truncated hemoglobin YjbI